MTTIEINGKSITFELHTVAGSLFLEATKINGERAYGANLFRIDNDGRFYRCANVNDDFGFKLNGLGQIKKSKPEGEEF